MKKVLSVFAFCAMGAMAADFSGTIMDTKCSTNEGDERTMPHAPPAASKAEIRQFW